MNPENTEYPEYNFEGFENNDEDDEGLSTAMSEVERHSLRNQMAGIHEAESLNYLESLRSPQSADDLLEMINVCAFLESTKEALRGLTRIRISTDKLLTNTQNIERAKLNFEAALLEITATAPTNDTQSPQWLTTTSCIRDAAYDIIERTFGAYRERRLQDVNRMEVVTGKLAAAQQKPEEKPQKKGIRFL
ncbi:MAG TPA: hypothetical protein O0X74_02325 [Methanocorpusculum sp.]|nr:hypothetical protein [Methanocorpusculum sp.]